MISDQPARRTALDLSRSFIVQAPAGSGKTELLIQRYLALLSSVVIPEEIVAITFTRKAAAEMRHRVIDALKQAENDAIPVDEHKKQTFRLANNHCNLSYLGLTLQQQLHRYFPLPLKHITVIEYR